MQLHVNVFSVWFLLLSIIIFRFIHIVVCSFLFPRSIPLYRNTSLSIHSSVNGYLGCVQFGAITNKYAVNIYVQLCVDISIFFLLH